MRTFLAWCAHAYTALGLVATAGIAVTIFFEQYHLSFWLMLAATVIDATDGAFARTVKVKEVLPHFDGRRLDDLIDFHTYTTLPLFRTLVRNPDMQNGLYDIHWLEDFLENGGMDGVE